jgi:hypothetical protein
MGQAGGFITAGAAQLGLGETFNGSHFSTRKIHAAQSGTVKASALKMRADKTGIGHIGTAKISTCHNGSKDIGIAQVSARKIGLIEQAQ